MKKERTLRLEVRLTEDELGMLKKASAGYRSTSDYVRVRLFCKVGDSNPVELLKRIDSITYEINKIGGNINQIAKFLNQKKQIPSEAVVSEYNELLTKYVKLLSEVHGAYKKIIAL